MYIDFIESAMNNYASRTALIFRGKEHSFRQLSEMYQKWIHVLGEKGIENAVVALRSDFSPQSIALVLAIIEKGNIFIPISLAVKNPEDLIDIAEVRYVLAVNEGEISVGIRKEKPSNAILKDLLKAKHPGLVLFSSGTTGAPKGAVHDLIPLLEKFKRHGKSFRTIAFLLFDHIGGFNTLFHMISNGGTIAIVEDRSVEEVCRVVEKFRIELLPTTPTFINMILFSRVYEKYDISCLKMITYGTEPMPEFTLKSLHRIFPEIRLKQTYGLSELGIMRSKSENSDSLWVNVGGEDYETKIVDEILFIKAKSAMKGYLNAPSPFDSEGWFNTQDRVEQKGEYIRFLGRITDIINVGGEKVYPSEVESVLLNHEAVHDASVHGEPHPLMGQVVTAEVTVASKNMDKQRYLVKNLRSFCLEHLEKFKVPVKINIKSGNFATDRFKRKH